MLFSIFKLCYPLKAVLLSQLDTIHIKWVACVIITKALAKNNISFVVDKYSLFNVRGQYSSIFRIYLRDYHLKGVFERGNHFRFILTYYCVCLIISDDRIVFKVPMKKIFVMKCFYSILTNSQLFLVRKMETEFLHYLDILFHTVHVP